MNELLAQAFSGTMDIIFSATRIVNLLIPTTAAIALLYFFWGMAKFILHADSDDGREEGKQVMIWGIVALFVIVSIWGIVIFIQEAFDIDSASSIIQIGGEGTQQPPFYCPPGSTNC